jgi:putative ABC transport system permease protein
MEDFLYDVRHSARQIVRRPGFSLLAILVVALGIGSATAIFSVFDTLVIRALPYADANRIVTIWQTEAETGLEKSDVAPANFLDWREQAESFEHLAALDPHSMDLTSDERPEVLFSARISEGFFEAFGTGALHGRLFEPGEYDEYSAVVILSHGIWQRRFGGDPELVGSTLTLDGQPHTVVGVLPPNFNPHLHPTVRDREAWIPLVLQGWEEDVRGSSWWNVAGKLKADVALAQARAEMDAISARLAQDYPETNAAVRANVVPLREHLVGNAKTALLVLQGAVVFLLLIACANVASLFLARGTERESEFAIRAALGAGRSRLIRQLFTESVIVALLGGALGVGLAYWSVELIVALGPAELPRIEDVRVDNRVLLFALGLAGLTAVVAGLVPALHFSRPDLRGSMSEGRTTTAGAARQRIRSSLVVAEVALSLVLVVGAGLLARSFVSLLGVDPGFDKENVAIAQVFRYVDDETPEERRMFFRQSLDGIRALPGVQSAAAVSAMPFIEANIDIQQTLHIEGRPEPRPEDAPNAFVAFATEDYFQTMSIPLLEGRRIERTDDGDSPRVAVVTEALVSRHWPGASPLGARIRIGNWTNDADQPIVWEIVGVVRQVRHDGLERDPRPELFVPLAQSNMGSMTFMARTDGDPSALLEPIQEQIWAIDPLQTFYRVVTLEELVSKSVAARRFNLWLLATFAMLALVLAAVGIYGVVSYSTRARTHEFGIRMALGADQVEVLRQAMSRGLRLTILGVGLGLIGSLGLTRLLQQLLFGIGARDPITFVAVGALLVLVAMAATYLPARRATLVDPAVALRVE